MSEPKNATSDPSMDDILASIRKIISDDEARAQVTGQPVASQPVASQLAVKPGPSAPGTARAEPATTLHDDVLLLTDIIETSAQEGGNAVAVRLPRKEPARPTEIPRQLATSTTKPLAGRTVANGPVVSPALVGGGTTEATTLAIARLNQAVQDSVPAPAAHEPGPSLDGNGKTVEDLVKEMLRPMLQEWLDRNLPPMVERYVEREILRLTRR